MIVELETMKTDLKASDKSLTVISGKLSVGLEIGYPPMEYFAEDGATPIGFDVELSALCAAIPMQKGNTELKEKCDAVILSLRRDS